MTHPASLCALALLLSVPGCGQARSQGDKAELPQGRPASFGQPAVLGRRDGELRVFQGRRPLWIKVDPQTLGSRSFTVGMEDLPPGDSIGVHKHLQEDEIVFVHRGTLEVRLGDSIRQAEAGGLVFIPRGTWIGFKVQGPDTATIVFMFNTPGFEKCLRFSRRHTERSLSDRPLVPSPRHVRTAIKYLGARTTVGDLTATGGA